MLNIFKSKADQPDETIVKIQDFQTMLDLFIQDKNPNVQDVNAEIISDTLKDVKDLLENGFKFEDDKGLLYYALYSSLTDIIGELNASDAQAQEISISTLHLETFKTSYIQLSEAALQFGGHSDKGNLPEQLWEYFSNNADGHGPEGEKYKATMLRHLVSDTIPAFFDKYPVDEISEEQLDFYSVPVDTPSQGNMLN